MYGQEQSHCRQLCYLHFERSIVVALVVGQVACSYPHSKSKLVDGIIFNASYMIKLHNYAIFADT